MPSFAATIDLTTLDGTSGFKLSGGAPDDETGRRLAFVGDVNGDGYGDVLIAASGSDLAGSNFGAAYLVFGGAGGFPAHLDLAGLDASRGLILTGVGGVFGGGLGGGMDLNHDGRADLVIGAPSLGPNGMGGAYVFHGQDAGFGAGALAVGDLDGSNGSTLTGQFLTMAGWEIATVGDVNGDGIDDLGVLSLISLPDATAFIVFGRDGGFGPTLSLADLNGATGFKLTGLQQGATRGVSLSGGGDINGDGIDDLVLGGHYGDKGGANWGAAYVVYGRDTASEGAFAATLNLNTGLDGTNGFTVQSFQPLMNLGYSVASIGDLNGDGFDDVAIGARRASIEGVSESGAVFVVFGKDATVSGAFAADLDLNSLDGSNGFWISGELPDDWIGTAVAAAGDVNGDGLADLLIGGAGSESAAGAAYVLFGRTNGFDARMTIADLDGTTGFRIEGEAAGDFLGGAVSAGDTNGDGLSDIILGAYLADPNGAGSGAAYVIYGIQADLTLIGTAADEALNGKTGDDTVHGLSGRDVLSGLGGDDSLDGGDMGDLLNGGDGADDLLGGAGGDVLNGDAGDDGLAGGDGGDKLFGGLGIDTLGGDAGADRLDGGDGADVLDGGADNDLLDGGVGADALTGGLGNDVFLVDDAGDTTVEAANAGFDIVRTALDDWVLAANIEGLELQGSADIDGTGNGGTNNLQGNSGANRLDGGAGVDTINGADGDDTIVGGLGNDLLRGGTGADVFLVGHVAAGTLETDQVYDFSTAEGDSLDLSAACAGVLSVVSAFTRQAGEMILTFAGGVTTVRLDTTGDGKVDYQVKINGDVTGDWSGWAL